MNKPMKVISFAITMFAIVGMISYAPVSATNGDEGCTPGFWKANAKKGANAWPDDITHLHPVAPTHRYFH